MKGLVSILFVALLAWGFIVLLANDRLPIHERPGYFAGVTPCE